MTCFALPCYLKGPNTAKKSKMIVYNMAMPSLA
jgi:hypothetical protein